MGTDAPLTQRRQAENGDVLEIVTHPVRARPAATVALLAYLGVITWALAGFSASALGLSRTSCTALLLLTFAVLLRRWFLPTRYRFDEAGIEVNTLPPRRYPWNRFRSWRKERGGYALSPFSDPRRFDNFRGFFLPLENTVMVLTPRPQACPASAPDDGGSSGHTPPRDEVDATIRALLKEKIDGRPLPVPPSLDPGRP